MGDNHRVTSTQTDLTPTKETGPADAATARPAEDGVLAAAVELARSALVEDVDVPTSIGAHVGHRAEPVESGFALTHLFAAELTGYRGWHWALTISRAEDSEHITVDESVLLPGDGAILVPAWLPWSERIRPEDLHPGDLVPSDPDDPRLVPAYVLSDDPAVEETALELGLGRTRVMSREGRLETAERWDLGPHGSSTAMAKHAPGRCGTCGFYLPINGSLGALFGACANEQSPADGNVVVADFGCGAHSDATPVAPADTEVALTPMLDTDNFDVEEQDRAVATTPAPEVLDESEPPAVVVEVTDTPEVVRVEEPSVVEVTPTDDAVVVEVHAEQPPATDETADGA